MKSEKILFFILSFLVFFFCFCEKTKFWFVFVNEICFIFIIRFKFKLFEQKNNCHKVFIIISSRIKTEVQRHVSYSSVCLLDCLFISEYKFEQKSGNLKLQSRKAKKSFADTDKLTNLHITKVFKCTNQDEESGKQIKAENYKNKQTKQTKPQIEFKLTKL